MPSRRDHTKLSAWLTTQLMATLKQIMHDQGLNPKEVPYGWRAMEALEGKRSQEVKFISP